MSTINQVLMLLEKNKDIYISGEEMAKSISLSRNSVFKAIIKLKKSGYKIDSSTKLGYKLSSKNDIISNEGIKFYIDKSLIDIPILTFETVESTNTLAKQLILENHEDKTVIIANEQTKGKGRMGKNFFSPKNNGIYMSIILKKVNKPMLITTSSSVAICRAIEMLSTKTPQIKWVNDIYLDNKKLCGILTEAIINCESNEITSIVLGIGINFNTKIDNFPDDIKKTATSLFLNGDIKITKNRLIAEILNQIFKTIYEQNNSIMDEYRKRSLVIGKDIKYLLNNNWFFGTAIDINSNGALIIKTSKGEIIELNSGEITLRIDD